MGGMTVTTEEAGECFVLSVRHEGLVMGEDRFGTRVTLCRGV